MKSIVIIGSGNVATHLSIALKNERYRIVQVFSRDISNAECLSSMVEAEPVDDLQKLLTDAELYIISVTDSAIEGIVRKMPQVNGVVAHTAGSVDISVLDRFPVRGVLYPFQTFTRDKELDFSKVPVLVEGNISPARKTLMEVAGAISNNIQKADGKKRKSLHISAVFACNFVNHLYALADELLAKEGLDFSLLEQLVMETTQKALSMKPAHAQTGPARRLDRQVMQAHLEALESDTFHYDIYRLLSESIMKMYGR